MSVYLILYIIAVHWVADFVLQSDWMAINKSKRLDALIYHVLVYTLALAIAFTPLLSDHTPVFILINFALHFATDFITSRVTSALWARNERHWFFVVVGFDQILHYAALFITFEWVRP